MLVNNNKINYYTIIMKWTCTVLIHACLSSKHFDWSIDCKQAFTLFDI